LRLLTEHSRRGEQLQRILQLDPVTDCAEIYRITALFELPWEMQLGHNLGYYQTLAAPRIAALLVQTREIERRPRKRAYDTGLLMYELFTHGFDHPQGRAVVRRLNQLHRGHDISNEDFLYVLAAFAVVPTRFINRYGWRRLTVHETTATWAFYAELGRRMNLRDVPDSYAALEALFYNYEQQHLQPTAGSKRLMNATQGVLADRLPGPLRPLADVAVSTLLDPPTRAALGLVPPPPVAPALLTAALRVRGAVVRRRPPRLEAWFTSGQPAGPYPDGYALKDLGPTETRTRGLH